MAYRILAKPEAKKLAKAAKTITRQQNVTSHWGNVSVEETVVTPTEMIEELKRYTWSASLEDEKVIKIQGVIARFIVNL